MKRKFVSALLCTALVAAMTVGCGGKSETADAPAADAPAAEEEAEAEAPEADDAAGEAETETPSAGGGRVFGYTCMDGTNPFFVTLEAAIREVVEGNGDTLISMDPGDDSNTQIDQIEDMIA